MNANSNWKRAPRRCALVLALGSLASLSAGPAMAGCGLYNPAVPPAQRVAPMQEGPKLIAAVYRPGAEGFIPVGHETSVPNSGIVGLWMVSFGNRALLTCRLVGCSAWAVRRALAMSTPTLVKAARASSPNFSSARRM